MRFSNKLLVLIIMGILGTGCLVRNNRHVDDYHRHDHYSHRHAEHCINCNKAQPGEPMPHHVQLHPGDNPSITVFPPTGGNYTIVISKENLYRLEDDLIKWRKDNGILHEEGKTGNQD